MGAINSVLASTLESPRIKKELIFAQLRSTALATFLMEKKRVELEDGGYEITQPLVIGRNENIVSYGYYDELPVEQTNELTKVRYGFSRVAGTVIVSQQEEDENMGESAVVKIVDAKLETLKQSISERFGGEFFYGIGAGKNPNGLGLLIPDDPTTGVVGGIDRAENEYWRTLSYQFNGELDSTNISQAFRAAFLDMKAGKSEKPDGIIVGRTIYEMYSDFLESKSSLAAASFGVLTGTADYGFEALKYGNVPVMYDPNCPDEKAYLINTKYLKLHVMRHVNMKVTQLNAPWIMDASGTRITWEGQLCLWKADRTQAVINNAKM